MSAETFKEPESHPPGPRILERMDALHAELLRCLGGKGGVIHCQKAIQEFLEVYDTGLLLTHLTPAIDKLRECVADKTI